MSSKGAPPSYKSEAWLVKMGWSRGDGLGKERSGRTEVVQVVKKDDNRGLGKQNYDLRDFAHWDNLFNKAAKKLDVHEGEEGVKIKKVKEEEKPVEVKPPSSYGGMFVKASSNSMHSTKRDYNEKDLFSICGSRDLRLYGQNGKHERLQRFDQGELHYVEPEEVLKRSKVASESDSTETEKRRKRKEKEIELKKRKAREESSEDEDSSSSSSSSSSEEVKAKKKFKSKSRKSKSKSRKGSSDSDESSSSSDSSSSSSSSIEEKRSKKAKRSRKESSEEDSSSSSSERSRKRSKKHD